MLRSLVFASVALAALAAGSASAQDPDLAESDLNATAPPADDAYLADENASTSDVSGEPSLSESEMDTSAPPANDGYLADEPSAESDPTLSESDLDASAPPADESYLADDADYADGASPPGGARVARTPGPAVGFALVALAGVAFALRRGA